MHTCILMIHKNADIACRPRFLREEIRISRFYLFDYVKQNIYGMESITIKIPILAVAQMQSEVFSILYIYIVF